jgi:putative pyrroloquinoline-quinone-binding quinoprotein
MHGAATIIRLGSASERRGDIMILNISGFASRLGFVLGVLAPCACAIAGIDVLTERYDDARLGANLAETELTTSNVNTASFGKLWSYTVSGSVYAQPLLVHNVALPGQGTHDVLYVATMNDMLYAFDADSSADTPLIEASFGTPIPILDILGYNDNIIGNVGIESTPVIDLASQTMYFVARAYDTDCGGPHPTFCQYLHAVDITTLADRPGSPVAIGGTVPCQGGSSCSGGTLTFDSKIEDQRSSLALSNGRIFIAWSGHSDQFAYHGWVMAYDAATLQQTMAWSSAPDGTSFNGGGIWMAGRAPTIDASGNVYYTTGNGTWDGVNNFGESFVKLGATPDAPLLDWFTPDAVDFLNDTDLDLGGSGPILVPGTDLIISGGKGGVFYVTHTGDMGHETTGDLNIVQEFDNSHSPGGHDQIKGGPIYWNRDSGVGPWMYVWSDGCNTLNAYHFNGTTFDTPPVSQSTILSQCGSSGGVLTLSANGSTPGSGIVWSSMVKAGDGNSNVHAGILRAFDADDLSTELWNSEQNHGRDDMGNWPKFSPPTVVDGHVYLGSFPIDGVGDTQVNVYGLFNPPEFTMSATPPNPGVARGGSIEYAIDTTAINDFTDAVHLDVQGLPPGATASFSANDFVPPASVTLTVAIDLATSPGEYPLTIAATSGSLEHDASVGFYVTDAAPGAGTISIDFKGSTSGTSLLPTDVAGVLPKPNWTEVDGLTGSALALVDESAVDTGATLAFTTQGWNLIGTQGTSPNFAMMNTAFDADGQTTTITVQNLPPHPGGYLVYIYADGANNDSEAISEYTLAGNDGVTQTAEIVDAPGAIFDGTFIPADGSTGGVGNYAVLLTSGTGFTLTVQAQGPPGGGTHAPINGMQIVRGDRIFASDFDE